MDSSEASATAEVFAALYDAAAEGQVVAAGERKFHTWVSGSSVASGAADHSAGRHRSRCGLVQALDSVEVSRKKTIGQRTRERCEREDVDAAGKPRGCGGSSGIHQYESGERRAGDLAGLATAERIAAQHACARSGGCSWACRATLRIP
jgi:hypothetical protein